MATRKRKPKGTPAGRRNLQGDPAATINVRPNCQGNQQHTQQVVYTNAAQMDRLYFGRGVKR